MTYPPTLPTTLRQVAATIDTTANGYASGDRNYLLDAARDVERGTADDLQVDDAIAIAKEYQEGRA